jgi:hypothetical protein
MRHEARQVPSWLIFDVRQKIMDRLSSARISTSAFAYLEAGTILTSAKKNHSLPAYFLFAQAIELSLKSYLRAKGYSKQALRDVSHDLSLCLSKARQEGFDDLLILTADERKLVGDLNVHYRSKDLQYTEVGLKRSYPPIERVEEFAKRLFTATRPFADQHLKAHYGKATAVP